MIVKGKCLKRRCILLYMWMGLDSAFLPLFISECHQGVLFFACYQQSNEVPATMKDCSEALFSEMAFRRSAYNG
ncbi:hypothetical protein GOP47_0010162 [Adiantum capillus-veneris]|uniref:Uncharacterized protein n=1 Tax=Adiantum capillus-veneris TaxID=13818 RepID=A0A9D4ZII1_ADICA|nr:hypothetical protein GOP47_0010162 [Adiantum capillus-veneris]